MSNFTITLKAARVNAGYTQKQAAAALEVSPATINAWECGRSKVSQLALRGMANLYGIPKDSFRLPTESANS